MPAKQYTVADGRCMAMTPYMFRPEHIVGYESAERRKREPPELIVSRVDIREQENVLDVGAGTGYIAVHVAKNFPKVHVFAVDRQPEMVEYMNSKVESYELRNLAVFMSRADSTRMKGGAIHHIFMLHLLHDLEDRDDVLREFDRILAPGGDITIVEPAGKEDTPGPPPEHRLDPVEAATILESTGRFRLERAFTRDDGWYQLFFTRK